jgi:hypothetical protein
MESMVCSASYRGVNEGTIMTKDRVYPEPRVSFGPLTQVVSLAPGDYYTKEQLDPLMDEIDALKTGLEIIDSQFKAEQNENDILRATIKELKAELEKK